MAKVAHVAMFFIFSDEDSVFINSMDHLILLKRVVL